MPHALPPTDVRPTLLIVDDSPENLTVLGELLQDSYTVRAANSGARALELAALQPQPDLILLDIMMPDMDGFQVLARLRADALTQDLPVIFVTAMSADADEEHGLALGAADYITKPIRPAVVLARVRNQLELRQARQQLKHQNDFLEQEINRRMHDNQLVQDVSIRAMAHLAETRDLVTGKHLRRVQEYIRLLAEQLRSHPRFAAHYTELLNVRSINLIAQSAHDIGIGIHIGTRSGICNSVGHLGAGGTARSTASYRRSGSQPGIDARRSSSGILFTVAAPVRPQSRQRSGNAGCQPGQTRLAAVASPGAWHQGLGRHHRRAGDFGPGQ